MIIIIIIIYLFDQVINDCSSQGTDFAASRRFHDRRRVAEKS